MAKFLAPLRQKFRQQNADTKGTLGGIGLLLGLILITLGIRSVAGFQPLEVWYFDWMMRSRQNLGLNPQDRTDSRLLIVAITEADIGLIERYPVSDGILAQALTTLLDLEPEIIGLDLYRDIPYEPGHQDLQKILQTQDNVVVIKTLGDEEIPPIPAPETVPPEQIGFNDLLLDPDGVVRRNLLFAGTETGISYSFSLRLALQYLAQRGIEPENDPANPNYIILGQAEFLPLKRTSGGYQRIDAEGYQILLDYRLPTKIAPTISLSQVLRGEINPRWVKDKIVLIGTTAPSGKDYFLTPFSPAQERNFKMPGVIIHGQMVSQILDAVDGSRPPFRFWPGGLEILWIIAWGGIGATLAWCARRPITLVFGNPALLAILASFSFLFFLNRYWVPTMAPGFALVVTSGIGMAYRTARTQRQRQAIMQLLGQNTSPEVAEALWRERDQLIFDGKLPGQNLTATILFCDIRNFSTISEQMEPEKLLDWLNEYLTVLTECIRSRHGIVNKFTGDGIMAAFGVPIPHRSDAEIAADAYDAVVCAVEMWDELERLNPLWSVEKLPTIKMRVGIYTGEIVAGSLGSKDRSEYGLLGDSVNIASRLESCLKERQAGTCRILITKETLKYIARRFEVESWGEIPLKGRQQLVDVYRVLAKNPWLSRIPIIWLLLREYNCWAGILFLIELLNE
ncbi:MAG: CHASE2 domain-containing protein [Microcoleaceae cyanobacterium]